MKALSCASFKCSTQMVGTSARPRNWAAKTCDHVPLAVNNDRYEKPKRFDAFCYLADLFARMQPWVFRV